MAIARASARPACDNSPSPDAGRGAPLAIDLFCGLGGWTEGLLAEGYRVRGYDIEEHVYGDERYPAELVLRDILTLHGSEIADADLIVSSSPCTKYSYMAMPWSRAKAQAAAILADETGEALRLLNALFDAQFRIQREASEAKGEYIPMVVENVRGAQPWVGRARATWGAIALWGDVPALLPPGGHRKLRGDNGPRLWSERRVQRLADEFRYDSDAFFTASSGTQARKAASAKIAKIPLVLSRHIGRVYFPLANTRAA